MIHGAGIGAKYHQIIEARVLELFVGMTDENRDQLTDQFMDFKDVVRNCSQVEFEEWYQLYKDVVIPNPSKRARRKKK